MGIRYKVLGKKYRVYGIRCTVQVVRYKFKGMSCKSTRYNVQGVHGTR